MSTQPESRAEAAASQASDTRASTEAPDQRPAAGPDAPAPAWYPYPPERDTRMRRSATDKMMAGVCGGIAEHTDIDPVYIRLAFLVSLFWGGIGLFAYIAAAVLMPRPVPPGP
ncbi:MAG: PspC domain-containing protein [Geodermatophilaceae bacterium]